MARPAPAPMTTATPTNAISAPASFGAVRRSRPTTPASSAVATGETAMIRAESPAVIWVRPTVQSTW